MNFTLMFGSLDATPTGTVVHLNYHTHTTPACWGWWINSIEGGNFVGYPDNSDRHYRYGYFGWFLRHCVQDGHFSDDDGKGRLTAMDLCGHNWNKVLVIGHDSIATHYRLPRQHPLDFELGEETKNTIRVLLTDLEQEGFSARFVRHPFWGDDVIGGGVDLGDWRADWGVK